MRKICSVLLIAIIIVISFAGCQQNSESITSYEKNIDVQSIPSQAVASNDNYEMHWNNDGKFIMLKSKATGKIWSNIPFDYFQSGGTSANVKSTINITISNNSNLQWDTIRGYTGVIEKGRLACEKIDNGVKVIYYFDNQEIMVPVSYVLRDDSIEATIDAKSIVEGDDFSLVAVSLAPFMTSASNDVPDSYLFVPSGSGALIYAEQNADANRKFSGEVYGTDGSRLVPENITDLEEIRLPVFGAKEGNNALLGIIENGAEAATIEAEAGNSRTGYSMVYPTFYVRGYDSFESSLSKSVILKNRDMTQVSTERSDESFTVGYYPLFAEDADYNGMAKRYRKYLEDNGELKKGKTEQSAYSVTLLGGLSVSSADFGIPHKVLEAMTTFSEAKTIIEDIYSNLGNLSSVRLLGYGNNGVLPGKIAGGYKFSSVYGTNAERLALEEYCENNNISLFTDFDLIRFDSSESLLTSLTGTAKSASLHTAEKSPSSVPTRNNDNNLTYKLINRDKLSTSVNHLIKMANKKEVSGLSLSTLGSIAYSDYSDSKYGSKGLMAENVKTYISNIKNAGHNVATQEANSYAAVMSDTIYNTPLTGGKLSAIDESVPFYQMVFRGAIPLYSSAINYSEVPMREVMLSASTGVGLGFTFINNYNVDYSEFCVSYSGVPTEKLYAAKYDYNRELLIKFVKEYSDLCKKIGNASIVKYELPDNGISTTIFENGVTVIANHTEKKIGELEPYSFQWNTVQ